MQDSIEKWEKSKFYEKIQDKDKLQEMLGFLERLSHKAIAYKIVVEKGIEENYNKMEEENSPFSRPSTPSIKDNGETSPKEVTRKIPSEFNSMALGVTQDSFSKNNSKMLDLIKLREKNKSLMDDSTLASIYSRTNTGLKTTKAIFATEISPVDCRKFVIRKAIFFSDNTSQYFSQIYETFCFMQPMLR